MKKENFIETLRLEKLRKLQKIIFLNPKRPADRTYNINVTLSEQTPLERNIKDTRPQKCPRHYDISKLPSVSVVIPFYNDALSMLLRTVHSVLMRTPATLLKEVIIVDDHSQNEDLHEPLEKYIKLLDRKVHLIRMSKREGLIRARLTGAKIATADVLMFQDAHTESNVQWAEPLLHEILKNPKVVIQPHVDQIEQFTLEYIGNAGPVPRGGFSWDLRYVWMEMPQHEARRVMFQHEFVAHRTPTLVGCAFAIRKDFFFSIGGFDDDMQIWGAENIELGFRGWMCGGEVLNHPCSRVAHTFKPFAYSFDGHREKIVQKNQMRLAEVWMDDWKKFFLASTNSWPTKHVSFTVEEKTSLEKRKIMKKNLKCKSFKWFMENIIPEVPTPPMNAVYYGEVFNLMSELCFYITSKKYVGLTSFCFFHRLLPKNLFHIDTDKRLIYRNRCVRIDNTTKLLRLGECTSLDFYPKENWDVARHSEVEGMMYVDVQEGADKPVERLCATQVTNIFPIHYGKQMPQLLPCNTNDRFQKWRWTYKFNFTYDWDHYTTSIEE
ncbi:hypothetical protein HELRODRAFT_85110 [Helobdella robusta]|uniref:Uncharacterized protein n=1 Tax=Helobdella robusta TaxID=6412 RepID=T1G5S9_HELRO|nr:hypothetical protein HELRODRAFT_85110 [Helobdella robusta]ESN97851.1 hypothetical protein HELRODRAFT_85110 [Helobdella robusta]